VSRRHIEPNKQTRAYIAEPGRTMTVTMMRSRYESKSQRLTVVDYVGVACVRKR
jgi:hypothetical protein